MAIIIYIIGVVLCIWCVYDLFAHKTIQLIWKVIIAILLLYFSWLGLLLYYFILRGMIK